MTLQRFSVTQAVVSTMAADGTLCDVANAAEELRAIRLWHWLRYQWLIETGMRKLDEARDSHLTMVQTLNQFFDIGDTAEKDAEK